MAKTFAPRAGAVFSGDIAVPEADRIRTFYSRIFGTGEQPLWQPDLTNNLGMPVLGIGAREGEYADLPIQWMPHIQVADVAASVDTALELGASVLFHSKDESGMSQWAVIVDPNGAAFGIISLALVQAGAEAAGSLSVEEGQPVGKIAWLDIAVPDAAAALDFYRQVIGWGIQEVAMQDDGEDYVDYAVLDANGDGAAGICWARGGNRDFPQVWTIYVPVGDLKESVRIAEELGGTVIKQQSGEDGGFVYAVVRDPVGAYIGLMPG